jgi:hypothetical protein
MRTDGTPLAPNIFLGECYLLGCDSVRSRRNLLRFRRNVPARSSVSKGKPTKQVMQSSDLPLAFASSHSSFRTPSGPVTIYCETCISLARQWVAKRIPRKRIFGKHAFTTIEKAVFSMWSAPRILPRHVFSVGPCLVHIRVRMPPP